MAVSEELLRRAQKDDRAAMEALLSDVYPSVYRIAHALTGRADAGRYVVHGVLRRSLRVMPEWRVGVIPENWYYHHTVLSTRDFSSRPPDPREDLLVTGASAAGAADPGYAAFVRALRSLPVQQAEAYVLFHGENLNDRLLGVAMDCSVNAAATHLVAATQGLGAVVGEKTEQYTKLLSSAYRAVTPPPETIEPVARQYVKKALRPKQVRRVIRWLVFIALVAGAYFAWRERDRWVPWVRDARAKWWDSRG